MGSPSERCVPTCASRLKRLDAIAAISSPLKGNPTGIGELILSASNAKASIHTGGFGFGRAWACVGNNMGSPPHDNAGLCGHH